MVIPKSRVPMTSDVDTSRMYERRTFFRRVYLRRLRVCADHLEKMSSKSIALEVGTGGGVFIPTLSNCVGRCIATDIHSNMPEVKDFLQKEKINDRSIDFVRCDIDLMPFRPGIFDLIVAISVLEHLKSPDEAVKEIKRVLKSGGSFVAGFPVENRISQLRKFILPKEYRNIRYDEVHVSSYKKIIRSCRKHFRFIKFKKFIPYVPLPLSLYVSIKCS